MLHTLIFALCKLPRPSEHEQELVSKFIHKVMSEKVDKNTFIPMYNQSYFHLCESGKTEDKNKKQHVINRPVCGVVQPKIGCNDKRPSDVTDLRVHTPVKEAECKEQSVIDANKAAKVGKNLEPSKIKEMEKEELRAQAERKTEQKNFQEKKKQTKTDCTLKDDKLKKVNEVLKKNESISGNKKIGGAATKEKSGDDNLDTKQKKGKSNLKKNLKRNKLKKEKMGKNKNGLVRSSLLNVGPSSEEKRGSFLHTKDSAVDKLMHSMIGDNADGKKVDVEKVYNGLMGVKKSNYRHRLPNNPPISI